MKSSLIVAAYLLTLIFPASVKAQEVSTPTSGELLTWVKSQQANAGLSYSFHKTKYAVTWWDAASYGQAGMNVGKAGALDYVDLGPIISVPVADSNHTSTRYGLAVPLHAGNIWNSSPGYLPQKLREHINLVTFPNVTVTPAFLYPEHLSLLEWRWRKDFQIAIAYRFGGHSQ